MAVTVTAAHHLYQQLGESAATGLAEWLNSMEQGFYAKLEERSEANFQRFRAELRSALSEQDHKFKETLLERDARIDRRFHELEMRLETGFSKVEARFEKVDARFEKVEGRLSNVETGLSEVREDISKLQAGLSEVQKDVSKVRVDVSRIEARISRQLFVTFATFVSVLVSVLVGLGGLFFRH